MEDFHHELEPKAPQMQREGDSVDDFEHLGHDSSPLGPPRPPWGSCWTCSAKQPEKSIPRRKIQAARLPAPVFNPPT
nr:unnamed protein product [Callosobruchus chinensis]